MIARRNILLQGRGMQDPETDAKTVYRDPRCVMVLRIRDVIQVRRIEKD